VEAGIPTERIRFGAHDLASWEPDGPYDLVTASFFHSQEDLPRTEILRRAAGQIAPGGHLAIVSHAPPRPGSEHHDHLEHLMDADGEIAALALGDDWEVVTSEHRTRDLTTADGEPALHEDVAVLLRRR
jgi:trans-aconitate methyltransferase